MAIAIKATEISKAYQLGEFSTGTLSRDIERAWSKFRGREDPFLKIGESNDRSVKGQSDIVWSLKNINFEIEKGDAIGIVGRNGAGKSTLLKILSRVTAPTQGSIKVKGRIASLLEVGTGFHPELTGRENIYLNGAILGMRKSEIKQRFDEIVDFSGVERYLDTPVKRYSSGMYVRLAFAVAAHLNCEIMIVDEVLAVGDAEFQKKCLGKMGDVSKGQGRTVLFVSHNMVAVKQLCSKGILLNNGGLELEGSTDDVIKGYSKLQQSQFGIFESEKVPENGIKAVQVLNTDKSSVFEFSDPIEVKVDASISRYIDGMNLGVAVRDQWKRKIFTSVEQIRDKSNVFYIKIPSGLLLAGEYSIDIAMFIPNGNTFNYVEDVCNFTIQDFQSKVAIYSSSDIGVINVDCEWKQYCI